RSARILAGAGPPVRPALASAVGRTARPFPVPGNAAPSRPGGRGSLLAFSPRLVAALSKRFQPDQTPPARPGQPPGAGPSPPAILPGRRAGPPYRAGCFRWFVGCEPAPLAPGTGFPSAALTPAPSRPVRGRAAGGLQFARPEISSRS